MAHARRSGSPTTPARPAPDVRERFEVASRGHARAGGRRAGAGSTQHAALVRSLVADAVLVLPTTPGPAPARTAPLDDVRAATLRMTALAGIGGLPALSVPALRVAEPARPRTRRRLPRRPPRQRPVPGAPRAPPHVWRARMTRPGQPAPPPAHGPGAGQRRPARAAGDVHAAGRPVRPGHDRVHERDAGAVPAGLRDDQRGDAAGGRHVARGDRGGDRLAGAARPARPGPGVRPVRAPARRDRAARAGRGAHHRGRVGAGVHAVGHRGGHRPRRSRTCSRSCRATRPRP